MEWGFYLSGTIWTKFFWSDWQADPALRLCSYAARGLWMDMLCIAATHDPIGYVAVAGRGLDETSIARMTGGQESEAHALLGELERNGVFSRDRKGTIYSRRMVADAKRSAIAKKNGKNGGNPSLSKESGKSFPVKGLVKSPDKPQEPIPIIHEEKNFVPAKAATRISYPDAFEEFWKAYPTDGNMSKKGAYKAWKKLSSEKREKALAAIPSFKSYCAENKKWYRIQHAENWLNDEKFEGFVAAKAAELTPEQIAANLARREALYGPKTHKAMQ